MNRRALLKGFAAGVAGLMVPVTVAEAAEEVSRRYWSLDRSMVTADTINEWLSDDGWARWLEAMEPRQYPLTDWEPGYLREFRPYDQATIEIGQSYAPVIGGPNHVYTASGGVYVLSRDGREIVERVS